MNEFYAAILGAIVGALAGGLVSYVLQMMAFREARKERRELRHEADKAAAFRLLLALREARSDLMKVAQHVEEAKKLQSEHGYADLWQALLPLANGPEPIHIQNDDYVFLIKAQEADLMHEISNVFACHESTITVLKSYHLRREQFGSKFPTTLDRHSKGTADPSPEKILEVNPIIADLRALADALGKNAETEADFARQVTAAFLPVFSKTTAVPVSITDEDIGEPANITDGSAR